MVRLKATTKARAAAELKKVIEEVQKEIENLPTDSERYKRLNERKDALTPLLWSMQNIAEDRTV